MVNTNNTSKHICFVSDTIHSYFDSGFKQGVGGAERQQYLIAQQLHNDGFSISVLTRDYDDTSPEIINGIEVWKEIPDIRGGLNAPKKAASLLTALRTVDADIYYVRGNDFLCLVTSLYCRLTDARFVYAVANDSDIEPEHLNKKNVLFKNLYLSSIRNADAVTVLTPHQKTVLDRQHGINATVVPCGYDLPPEDELLNHDEREFVLWVGRLDPDQKKPERYLQLAKDTPEVQFVMIGPPDNDDEDRSYFDLIRTQAESLNNMEFIEFVPPDEIHEYFRKASLLVNTSDYEGFGNVFLEAWRYATPAVTLHYTLHGVIDEQNVGVHVDSIDDLSTTVRTLHQNSDQRSTMGIAGRELVCDNYSMRAVMDQYREIFTRI